MIRSLVTAVDTVRTYGRWAALEVDSRLPRHAQRPARQRRLLVLAWFFPPAINSGVFRPLSFVTHGARIGWDITLVSGRGPANPTAPGLELLRRVPEGVRVDRITPRQGARDAQWPDAPRRVQTSYRWTPHVDGGFINALDLAAASRDRLQDAPPSVVLATGPPFHGFIAAMLLARRFRARLVLDYRDEWTCCPFDFVDYTIGIDDVWERRCLDAADLVLMTTRSQIKHSQATFPGIDAAKYRLVPNGWEPSDFERGPSDQQNDPEVVADPDTVTLSYIGDLGAHCLPGSFLTTLGAVLERRPDLKSRLRLQFVGTMSAPDARDQIEQFPDRDMISIVGHVPKPVANQLMRKSAGLLLLNEPRMERYLPGKIYDYLAADPPILVYGAGGEISSLVEQLDAGTVVALGDVDGLERALTKLMDPQLRGNQDREHREEWLSRHTRAAMAQRVFTELDALLGEGPESGVVPARGGGNGKP